MMVMVVVVVVVVVDLPNYVGELEGGSWRIFRSFF